MSYEKKTNDVLIVKKDLKKIAIHDYAIILKQICNQPYFCCIVETEKKVKKAEIY